MEIWSTDCNVYRGKVSVIQCIMFSVQYYFYVAACFQFLDDYNEIKHLHVIV